MKRTLIGTITEKAAKTIDTTLDIGDNYLLYIRHWIKTAVIWRDELAAEGLVETVAKLDEIIQFEVKHNKLDAIESGIRFSSESVDSIRC